MLNRLVSFVLITQFFAGLAFAKEPAAPLKRDLGQIESELMEEVRSEALRIMEARVLPHMNSDEKKNRFLRVATRVFDLMQSRLPSWNTIKRSWQNHRALFVIEAATTGVGLTLGLVVANGGPISLVPLIPIFGNPLTTGVLYSAFLTAKHVRPKMFTRHTLKSEYQKAAEVLKEVYRSFRSPFIERRTIGFLLKHHIFTHVFTEMDADIPVIKGGWFDRTRLAEVPVVTHWDLLKIVKKKFGVEFKWLDKEIRKNLKGEEFYYRLLMQIIVMDQGMYRELLRTINARMEGFVRDDRVEEARLLILIKEMSSKLRAHENKILSEEKKFLEWLGERVGRSDHDAKNLEQSARVIFTQMLADVTDHRRDYNALRRIYRPPGKSRKPGKHAEFKKNLDRLVSKSFSLISMEPHPTLEMRCLISVSP